MGKWIQIKLTQNWKKQQSRKFYIKMLLQNKKPHWICTRDFHLQNKQGVSLPHDIFGSMIKTSRGCFQFN